MSDSRLNRHRLLFERLKNRAAAFPPRRTKPTCNNRPLRFFDDPPFVQIRARGLLYDAINILECSHNRLQVRDITLYNTNTTLSSHIFREKLGLARQRDTNRFQSSTEQIVSLFA